MTSIVPPEDVHLATGWEPDLPAADSLVRQAVLAHAEWGVVLARSAGGSSYDGDTWAGGAGTDRGLFMNWVIPKQPTDPREFLGEVDELIPDGPYLFVSAWPTPDLRPHGLGLAGHPPLMARFPATVTEAPKTDLDIHRVDSAAGLADAERVLIDGYPLPELQPCVTGTLLNPALLDTGIAIWVGYDGDTPLATAAAYSAHGVTLVENVAVMPQARGRGAGAALTWTATALVPDQPAVLVASDDGQPIYQRLGYVRLERWTVWVRPGR